MPAAARWVALALALVVAVAPAAVRADGFRETLSHVLDTHDRIQASAAGVRAARERVEVAKGAWYPTVTLTTGIGIERQVKPDAANTDLTPRDFKLSVTQLLYDFGATGNAISKSRLDQAKAEVALDLSREGLIFEYASAYANLARAFNTLDYAMQSEENIRRQTGLEQIRIEEGSGLSTDLLQAQTQLAGAQARRTAAEGAYQLAVNRYLAVVGDTPPAAVKLDTVTVAPDLLPAAIDDAVAIALEESRKVLTAVIERESAERDLARVRATSYAPRLQSRVDRSWEQDLDGTEGFKGKTLGRIELVFPFNLGLTALNDVSAANEDLASRGYTLADVRRTVQEEVRNAWTQLGTAEQRAEFLQNQAAIAAAFLDLAKEERRLGRRSLIDVLAGETALINAQSDAEAARTDTYVARLAVLKAIGRLDPTVFVVGGEPPRR